ncbi:EAL domain-containing protein [Bosea sp. (in: a-proteobacteria)]|jgi:PAS domain S-box-containing protein|uniref:putative bifunctional diguanylate cyclase/phosphodiesterase n=1 Tax=Bosea sp. (in: a-proteobacteria) TaxID=1871050 RepID=UPI003F72AC45
MFQAAAGLEALDQGFPSAAGTVTTRLAAVAEAGVDLSAFLAARPQAIAGAATDAWLASVLDQLPVAVYITDAQGRLTYFNRATAQFAGREPRIGDDFWCVTHRLLGKDGKPLAPDQYPMAIALREARPVRGVEVQAERPDGSRVPFMPFPTPLFDGTGRLVGGFNLLLDISERKHAERAIAALLRQDAPGGLAADPQLAEQRERQDMLRHLREAIAGGAIRLQYQPQFRTDGEVVGFEALARWRHPTRGVISPSQFIPAAEEGGLIAALGAHVLRSACREAAGWARPLRVSVNISPLEFESDDLPALVEAVLDETGLDPDRLELEITEGVMVTDAARAMAALSKLRALGVRIALDDFGTGYSSLSYLHRFPLTTLKIDRSFVATLGVTLEAAAITRAIIQLGHALGIEVVAEGVETPEQLDFLICEGCDLTQGYLLGRPLDASAYAHLTG